jgi:hypothetical protein
MKTNKTKKYTTQKTEMMGSTGFPKKDGQHRLP